MPNTNLQNDFGEVNTKSNVLKELNDVTNNLTKYVSEVLPNYKQRLQTSLAEAQSLGIISEGSIIEVQSYITKIDLAMAQFA